ncbi:protein-L-isoaspartate(D-aspartate) O-methyltransferase [Ascidiimonas aurantiaca]|uniref:protein-L-isoaspartate(D-aspartate) O-methyltransferase n=1 Tax=Ascidiimonas aurantiaca TaxID=1685432 RepID=UPI0030EDA4CC
MKVVIFILCLAGTVQNTLAQTLMDEQREKMIREQLVARGITSNTVLNAMRDVPRHVFVPENERASAYTDGPLPIGEKQTISQPYMVAYITQALQLKPTYRVLEIGTGSGYQAAVLAEIVDSVYTIEIVRKLGMDARSRLDSLGYSNIEVQIGDGYHGWPANAPFDAIMVTAGAESVPPALVDQLKDGGKMIIPVGPHRGVRKLLLITKKGNKIKTRHLMNVRFVPFTRHQ